MFAGIECRDNTSVTNNGRCGALFYNCHSLTGTMWHFPAHALLYNEMKEIWIKPIYISSSCCPLDDEFASAAVGGRGGDGKMEINGIDVSDPTRTFSGEYLVQLKKLTVVDTS